MNSAVLPHPGTYRYIALTEAEAVLLLQMQEWESRIGYPETAQHIWDIANIVVSLSRERTAMQVGDEALVIRLKYRIQDPGTKRTWQPGPDDWEYGLLMRLED